MTILQRIQRRWGLARRDLRGWRLRRCLKHLGSGARVNSFPVLSAPGNISIGDRCSINHGVVLGGRGGLTIGDDVRLSHYAVLESGFLEIREADDGPLNHGEKPIRVGNRVWIAIGATVLAGVTIGDGAVVAAGAVVTRDVPPYHLAKGIPARCTPLSAEPEADTEPES